MCWKFVLLFCAQCSRYGHSGPEEEVQLLSWLVSYYSSHVSLITGIPFPLQSCSYIAVTPYSFSFGSVSGFFQRNPESACVEAWDLIPTLVRCCTCLFLAGNIGDYFTDNVAQGGENGLNMPCFPSSFNGGNS